MREMKCMNCGCDLVAMPVYEYEGSKKAKRYDWICPQCNGGIVDGPESDDLEEEFMKLFDAGPAEEVEGKECAKCGGALQVFGPPINEIHCDCFKGMEPAEEPKEKFPECPKCKSSLTFGCCVICSYVDDQKCGKCDGVTSLCGRCWEAKCPKCPKCEIKMSWQAFSDEAIEFYCIQCGYVDNHEQNVNNSEPAENLYDEARHMWQQTQFVQVKKGMEKYGRPLNPDEWTAGQLVEHIFQENVDQAHYAMALARKCRELEEERDNLRLIFKELFEENAGLRRDNGELKRDVEKATEQCIRHIEIKDMAISDRDALRKENERLRRDNGELKWDRVVKKDIFFRAEMLDGRDVYICADAVESTFTKLDEGGNPITYIVCKGNAVHKVKHSPEDIKMLVEMTLRGE